MSLPPDRHDELLALLGAIRDERINAAEFERLERLLAEFPQAREIFLQYITLHAAFEQAGAAELTPGRLREIIRDEQTVQELRSMIAADERSAFATRAHRSKRRRYLAATLTAAALVLLAVFVGQRVLLKPSVAASSAQIAAVYGPVESSAAGVRLPIAPGAVVRPGTSLKTGPNAYLRLQYPDGSTLDLKDATELALLDETQAKRLSWSRARHFLTFARNPPARR